MRLALFPSQGGGPQIEVRQRLVGLPDLRSEDLLPVDSHLRFRIRSEIEQTFFAPGVRIDVRVEQRWVYISGITGNARQVKMLERIARAVKGVRGVTNQLQVALQ